MDVMGYKILKAVCQKIHIVNKYYKLAVFSNCIKKANI